MQKLATKPELEQKIRDELQKRFPDTHIEGIGLVVLPNEWNVVAVSHDQPVPGDILAAGRALAASLRHEYKIVPETH